VLVTDANPLVLGSASPRRRELLAIAGIPFRVVAVAIDETSEQGEPTDAYLDRVTRAKLGAVRAIEGGTGGAVLVADTVVIGPDGSMMGKPSDQHDAEHMIERLSGAIHLVSTRFLLASVDAGSSPVHAQTVTTRVMLRSLSADEVQRYAATGEGTDKAGGYAIQGMAAAFVERIEGSYTNVVGLPLSEVIVALTALGWLVPRR
jgi:septum formation protein